MAIEYAQEKFGFLYLYDFRYISVVTHISSSGLKSTFGDVCLRGFLMMLHGMHIR